MQRYTIFVTKKNIRERIERKCAVCGKTMRVILYTNGTYRSGHYFGKIPLHRKSELNKMKKSGTHVSKIGDISFNVYNYDPKPYKWVEYWECPKCYWN